MEARPVRGASLLLPAALLGTAGCLGGGPVDLRYQPGAAVRPLEGEHKPAIYVGRFVDAGGITLASGDHARLLLKRPVQDSIKEALTEELRRLGFPIAGRVGIADALLSGGLAKGEITGQERSSREAFGLVRLTIDLVVENRDGQSIWEGELNGVGDISVAGSVGGAANSALADAMAGLGPLLTQDRVVARIAFAGAKK